MTTFEIVFAYIILALGTATFLVLVGLVGSVLWFWLESKFF